MQPGVSANSKAISGAWIFNGTLLRGLATEILGTADPHYRAELIWDQTRRPINPFGGDIHVNLMGLGIGLGSSLNPTVRQGFSLASR
jgi:hypothetical protein